MTQPLLGVLVVDDDYRIAALHAAFVEKVPGFVAVGLAHSADEARGLVTTLDPDLILLDVYLPDGDGISLIRQLLDARAAPAIIVISAANDVETVMQAVQLGALHYLIKPFGFDGLADRLVAFRAAREKAAENGDAADQAEVDRIFALYRPLPPTASSHHLAPTAQLVFEAVAAHAYGVSAVEVAKEVGISRTTAQRCLMQLEQSRDITLKLRYGSTGRPEHRYSALHD